MGTTGRWQTLPAPLPPVHGVGRAGNIHRRSSVMKEMRRRLAAVLLGLSLVPALAACGSGGGGTEAGGTVYTPSFVRCEAGMEQISAGCADGETL